MTLENFLDLYDNWNGILVVNDKNLNTFATVRLFTVDTWLKKHSRAAKAQVMAFGFYDGEICIRINIQEGNHELFIRFT